MSVFRTRQAPSPTGYLHLGTARQVLFTKLFALINKGVYYLRLEDTDRNRLNQDAATSLLDSLRRLYLLPDEGVTLGSEQLITNSEQLGQKVTGPDEFYGVHQVGNYGPYIQSERLSLYHEHAQKLIDKRLAYWSYLTEEEKNELQEIKKVNKRPINYYKISVEKSGEADLFKSVAEGLSDERKPALRYKIQRDEKIRCKDELVGESEFDLNLEEDFTILKSDGFPTYHLAHLIDDYLMETTLVFRAQEWYPSIVKHQVMFMDYWGAGPKYLHVPFIMGETGTKKMSKRDGNVNMRDYLDKGYLPEAIINYLAFLGWNPGTEKELYLEAEDFRTLDQEARVNKLIQNIAADFAIDKLSKAPARFNLEKLNWFNREYIKMLSLKEFAYLADKNRLEQNIAGKNLRVGDYVWFVDEDKQMVYLNHCNFSAGDGDYYPIGGGRDTGENGIQSVIREVEEETVGQVKMEEKKILPIGSLSIVRDFKYVDGTPFAGKTMYLYYYPLSADQLADQTLADTGTDWEYAWHPVSTVIKQNTYLTFPIWRNFCLSHNLPLFEADNDIAQYYLAYLLDKNRVTVLSEIGADSGCILHYREPNPEDIKWKKSTIEESQFNLQEILAFIETQKPEIKPMQDKLYQTVKNSLPHENGEEDIAATDQEIQAQFQGLVAEWEKRVKTWLQDGGRDTGSYLWPLRVHLSGKIKSPSPFELLAVKLN